jgi:hypothetical protein
VDDCRCHRGLWFTFSTTHCVHLQICKNRVLLLLQNIIFVLCVAGRGGSIVQFALQLSMLKTTSLLDYFPRVRANITMQSTK